MKTLLGCPSLTYLLEGLASAYQESGSLQMFIDIRDLSLDGSLFSLSSSGFGSDDTKTNFCGVTIGHAFPILGFLEIDGNSLYMVRDPRGEYAHTRYNQAWGIDDE